MGLTSPYEQHNYLGEYASEAGALAFIRANKWDSSRDGLGTFVTGMAYYDTVLLTFRIFSGVQWQQATLADHAYSHQHGGMDEVATATPAANAIPKADGSGRSTAGSPMPLLPQKARSSWPRTWGAQRISPR